jgi:hypothetical protein
MKDLYFGRGFFIYMKLFLKYFVKKIVILIFYINLAEIFKQIIMKDAIKKEILDLQEAWKKGITGMSVNEYTSTLHELYKKLKK